MKMLMKNGLIALAAACAFGSGALGAAWAQSQTGESATDATRREASSDKAVDKKAAAKKESASRKAAAAKKEKEAVAERASRIDPEAPVLAAGGVFKCVDRDGNITYGNVGDVKGCKTWEQRNQASMERAQRLLAELGDAKAVDLAMLSVALRELRNLA